MSPLPVQLTSQAETDLIDIWLHIARDNQPAADRMLDRIEDKWRLLAAHPYMGVIRADISESTRHLLIGPYVVLYRVQGSLVVVMRILHGRRRITMDDLGPD